MQPRPISLTVFGILNLGFGLLALASMGLALLHLNLPAQPAASGAASKLAELYNDPSYQAWTRWSSIFGGVGGIALIAAGAGLLLCRNWARILSITWAVFDIVIVLASIPFTREYMSKAMAAGLFGNLPAQVQQISQIIIVFGLILGVLVGLAYPILLIIFMTRPRIVAACTGAAQPPETFSPPPTYPGN